MRRPRRMLLGLISTMLLCLLLGIAPITAQDAIDPPAPLRPLDLGPFAASIDGLTPSRIAQLDELVLEATLADLQAAMANGDLTSVELTTYYLSRINDLDVGGLQSMNELNPEALDIAAALDGERAEGTVRGPLHGVPISLKDNIGTGDAMHTTAGAAALEDARSDQDASVAARLREAGAVLIGKANMTEWANFMNQPGQAGYSALGGQVQNVYDPALSPSGSSAGSAVGTSANLVAASIGTETEGSIIAPATAAGIVGLKPSLGLVSRHRVIPITDQTDTPGPLTRTVADAATLLTVISGEDPADPTTSDAAALAGTDFTTFLDPDALEGKRVGFFTGGTKADPDLTDEAYFAATGFTEAVTGLQAAGAEVSVVWGDALDNQEDFTGLGVIGLRDGVAAYLEATDPDGEIGSIADVVTFNAADLDRYAPFGQNILEAAAGAPEVSRDEYVAGGAQLREQARGYLDALLADNDLDVLVSSGNRLSGAYAVAGYPAITVPAGRLEDGTAVGLTFTGRYLEDGPLLGYAYAFEQASGLREPPPAVTGG